MEQGINQPDINTLKQLAQIFGVTVDEIVETPQTDMLATILPFAGVVALPFAICLVYQDVLRKRTVTEGAR